MVNNFQNSTDLDLDLKRMAALAIEIERLRHEFQPMPDDVMDFLTEARWTLAETVMQTPADGMRDIGAKLAMLSAITQDDDSFDPALHNRLATCASDATEVWNVHFVTKSEAA